jgi:hypothetical protein
LRNSVLVTRFVEMGLETLAVARLTAEKAAGPRPEAILGVVTILHARVKDGRLVIDEPTDLPEGAAVDLLVLDAEDSLSDEERDALRASIDRGLDQSDKGEVSDAAEVPRRLRSV